MTTPDPPDQGGTWISSREIYAELRRIGDEVVGLRHQLSTVTQLQDRVDALAAEVDDLNARRWPLQAVNALCSVAAGVIAVVALFVA